MNMNEKNKIENCRIEPKLKLINMDSVEVEQVEWLLYPFIPYGKVTIIQGDPGEWIKLHTAWRLLPARSGSE